MPYLAHFGLRERPFTLTPNTGQYFPVPEHANILESLRYGIETTGGIFKIVGDVGTGKTLLCRVLLRQRVNRDAVAYLNAPQCDTTDLVESVCREFGLPTGSKAMMLRELNLFLLNQHAQKRNVVLIVDEAQALGAEGLETIRLLSNLETEHKKLMQIVLFGQPELDELLGQKGLRQLAQRIAYSFKTGPFGLREAVDYIHHRVRTSRHPGVDFPLFERRAAKLIARSSNGVPRVINILSEKAMLIAYAQGAPCVSEAHVEEAIDDSRPIAAPVHWHRRSTRRMVALVVVLQLVVIAGLAAFHPTVRDWTTLTLDRISAAPAPGGVEAGGVEDSGPQPAFVSESASSH